MEKERHLFTKNIFKKLKNIYDVKHKFKNISVILPTARSHIKENCYKPL